MLRKTVTCSFMALACAAAFTLVSAQMPWETEAASASSPSESSSEEAASETTEEAASEATPYDYGSATETATAETTEESVAEAAPAKPEKVKKERAAAAGFSSQKGCPVCNSVKIKSNLYVGYSGGRIHVCNISCIGRVKRDPAAFAKVLEARGESPER